MFRTFKATRKHLQSFVDVFDGRYIVLVNTIRDIFSFESISAHRQLLLFVSLGFLVMSSFLNQYMSVSPVAAGVLGSALAYLCYKNWQRIVDPVSKAEFRVSTIFSFALYIVLVKILLDAFHNFFLAVGLLVILELLEKPDTAVLRGRFLVQSLMQSEMIFEEKLAIFLDAVVISVCPAALVFFQGSSIEAQLLRILCGIAIVLVVLANLVHQIIVPRPSGRG